MADLYELYLIRHGLAEERGEAWPDDTKRPLTDRGIARLRKTGRGLVNQGVTFDVVLTSPLVRARQTAETIASAYDVRPPIVTAEAFAPGGTWAAITAELEKHSRRTSIAIVGHEPDIGELAGRLIGSKQAVLFKKGAICRIDVEALPPTAPGLIRWFLPPKMLRALRHQ